MRRSNPVGGRAEIKQIYPFLYSAKFHRLNERWVKVLKTANGRLAVLLKADKKRKWKSQEILGVDSFPHELFLWIRIQNPDVNRNILHAENLALRLKKVGVPAIRIPSLAIRATVTDRSGERG